MRAGAVACALILATSVPAFAQSTAACGGYHVVAPGETLRGLTLQYYGHDRFLEVFEINRTVLNSPGELEVGQRLHMPCPATDPQTTSLTAQEVQIAKRQRRSLRAPLTETTTPSPTTIATEPLAAPNAAPASAPLGTVRALSLRGHPPYAGTELPQAGLLSALMSAALRVDRPTAGLMPIEVDDPRAHLDHLLGPGLFALSFPWMKPDCRGAIDGMTQQLCTGFVFSRPLFESTIAVHVRPDSGDTLPTGTICVPHDMPEHALAPLGIARARLTGGIDTGDCLARLARRDVAGVVADVRTVEALAGPSPATALGAPRHVWTLHAIARKDNPRGRLALSRIDAGLAELQRTGTWFEIVSAQMSAHGQRVATGR